MTSRKLTKKKILSYLDDLDEIVRDPRFTPEYKISQTVQRVDFIAGSLRHELERGFGRG